MALVACHECGKEISTEASACPICGAKPSHTKWWLWIPLGLVGAFLTLGAVVGSSPEAEAQQRERDVIEMCWDDQKSKSLDPATARFVAGTCEMLERRFLEKHGRKP